MINGYKVVVVTPAGRKCYLELLIPQIQNLRNYVDEYRLWVNTTNKTDIDYMESKAREDSEFIKLEYCSVPVNGNLSINSFFKNCIEPNTIFIRFDDDIVMLDTPDTFKKFVEFRIEHPEYFLVFGNILNNSVISHLHQRFCNFNLNKGIVGYHCGDPNGWVNGDFAINLHEQILENPDLSRFHLKNNWLLYSFERVSINCISWLGSEFAKFNGIVGTHGTDEEQWLSSDKPRSDNKMNIIFGDFCCVHYAFFTQRPSIDNTNILERYKKILAK